MTKVKILNVRLDPEKTIGRKVLDYSDQSLIPKTTPAKTTLTHEVKHLKTPGDPYVKDNLKASETPENRPGSSVGSRERLWGGFDALSDEDT